MELPEPEPGLVIRYSYLWSREADRGEETGRKDRPCAIVVVVVGERGQKIVYVAPITHSPPQGDDAVEIPGPVKARLGLDDVRSWAVVTEVNAFVWPGPDLSPANDSEFSYGFLPGALTARIIKCFRAKLADRVARAVKRQG